MPLVLVRRVGESVEISGPAVVTVNWIGETRVSLLIQAAPDVVIDRSEVAERKRREAEEQDP